ncbi:MAG: extracellular solute-binding protein, partial [candidate division NC10 bacterium]|nr:extracellular solute-binding protein [candidate division NC10 bacterium]
MKGMSGFRKVMVLVVGIVVTAGLASAPAEAQQRVQVEFWHGLTQPLGGILEKIATDFNASQTTYQVNATFKGSYPETMVAAIAAFRAGNAPHIVQMFEVGTATMMAARTAIKPVYELAKETGVNIDPKNYVGGVRGYYSTADGKLVSMPFNSSTPITWYNKDAFKKAGLDPEKPPKTWEETREAAKKIREANAAACGYTMAWPTWTQFENFSAIHNVPLATKANGMKGMDAELKINSPLHVKHLQTLMDMHKEGT